MLRFRHRRWSDEARQDVEQQVWTDRSDCHFGGSRPWFFCRCGRRVGKLYLGSSPVWACRGCYGLAYASQHEDAKGRGILRAQRIRARLGGDTADWF